VTSLFDSSRFRLSTAACGSLSAVALCALLSGCSSIETIVSGDKVDYRTQGEKTQGLEIPPDLTQLNKDLRFQSADVSVSATQLSTQTPSTVGPAVVAPQAVGNLRIERQGEQRWLSTHLTPEQLWPVLQGFWPDNGFTLTVDQPTTGVMETQWAENRAKLPQDVIRRTIGKVFDSLYSTGERDKFRTRVERSGKGTEIYISHRGMVEVFTSTQKDSTVWQPRPSDPQLEAEFLQRLMIRLGAKEEQAKAAGVASAPSITVSKAQILSPSTLQVNESFDAAWRRVGLALDRSDFTVEDRDRKQGIYFVRYVDPASSEAKNEKSFLGRLFSRSDKEVDAKLAKYQILVKSEGERSVITVLNSQGTLETSNTGKRIAELLMSELK
jgi:outer membrane protein assembly factor BamC